MNKKNIVGLLFALIASIVLFAACGGPEKEELIDITGITFMDESYDYDGAEKSIVISGELPEGATVDYTNNKAIDTGVYNASAIVSGAGYNTLTLTATLTINGINITGITFTDATYDYDGTEKTLVISGEVPNGVTVTYTNNKATNADELSAQAVLSGTGYNTLTLTATLTINKIEITGFVFADLTTTQDNSKKSIFVTGLPNGVNVEYTDNGQTETGTYTITAKLTGANFIAKTITAKLTIRANLDSYLEAADALFDYLITKPDPYQMLAETLIIENRFDNTPSYSAINYSSDVKLSNIPTTGIGQQLNAMYDASNQVLSITDTVTEYYSVISQVLSLYKTYIAGNPESPFEYQVTVGNFSVLVEVGNNSMSLIAEWGAIKIETEATLNPDDTVNYSGYIRISTGNELRYESTPESIKIGVLALGAVRTMIDFKTEGDYTTGSVYVYYGAESLGYPVGITKRIELRSNINYTGVIGADGDSYLGTTANRNMEIYRNSDGRFIGSEIYEETKILNVGVEFDTLWYPLQYITGFNSVKAIENTEAGITGNKHLIYINGQTSVFKTKNVGGLLNPKQASRRYDIEMRKEYFYNYNSSTEKYEKVEVLIPFLFIQQEVESEAFGSSGDIMKENKYLTTVNYNSLFISETDRQAVTQNYSPMLTIFNEKKDNFSNEDVESYVRE